MSSHSVDPGATWPIETTIARAIFESAKDKTPWEGTAWDDLPEEVQADYKGQVLAALKVLGLDGP